MEHISSLFHQVAFLTPSLHSSDILRASLSRRASECTSARGSFQADILIKTTSTSSSSSGGSSIPSKQSADIQSDAASRNNSELNSAIFGETTAAVLAAAASGTRNSVASNVLIASNKKNKLFAGKQERHKSEAVFDTSAVKAAVRPAHSVIGDGYDGKSAANNSKRPLSLELEQKTTETVNNSTTTATQSNARGYREIISPSISAPNALTNAATASASGLVETPRSRRAGKQITSSPASDMKVVIVWLQSYEDRVHFPVADLFQNHCLTGTEAHSGRSSGAQNASESDASNASDLSSLFIIFVHPLQNGLFRVNLQSPSSRYSAMAIPVVSGMVLSRRLLGLTIRQAVINICQRKRLDDADVNQPPHVRRRYKIQEIMSKYHEQMADAEFLTSLFREVP